MACDFYGPDNAAKLLGPKFRGEDGGMTEDAEGKKWRCTFMPTGDLSARSPKIHIMVMSSPSVEVALQAFADVRRSNSKMPGWQEWNGVGDEAIVHGDGENFHLIMVRKGTKSFRIKANPAVGVSLEESKTIARSLADKLARQ
ncbi:MAG: hypothetical protein QM785_03020 [Pyrinomonadaceae bacterium]